MKKERIFTDATSEKDNLTILIGDGNGDKVSFFTTQSIDGEIHEVELLFDLDTIAEIQVFLIEVSRELSKDSRDAGV